MSKRRQPSVSEPNKPFPSRGASSQQKAAKHSVYFLSFLKLPTMSSSASASSPPLSLSSLPLPLRHASPQCVKRYQIRFEHCECHVINSAYSMSFFRILRAVPICPSFTNDALLVRVQLDTRAEQRDLQATLQQEVCAAECYMTVNLMCPMLQHVSKQNLALSLLLLLAALLRWVLLVHLVCVVRLL